MTFVGYFFTFLFCFQCIQITTTYAFSTPSPPSPPQPLSSLNYPFQSFQFATNDVCIFPETFYYTVVDENSVDGEQKQQTMEFTMRNVPGNGDCMFQAVILGTTTSMGLGGNDVFLKLLSHETRNIVADVLGCTNGNLHVEGNRIVRARDLLNSAARTEGISTEEYLRRLRSKTSSTGRAMLEGGGPELTVLANVLRRPITIYELCTDQDSVIGRTCEIKAVGSFGDIFIDPIKEIPNSAVLSGIQPGAYSWHVHILVVDSGPNNEKHACTLLPRSIYT